MTMQEVFIMLNEVIAEMNQQGTFIDLSFDGPDYSVLYESALVSGGKIKLLSDTFNNLAIIMEVSFCPVQVEANKTASRPAKYIPDHEVLEFLALAEKLNKCLQVMQQHGYFHIIDIIPGDGFRISYEQAEASSCILLYGDDNNQNGNTPFAVELVD